MSVIHRFSPILLAGISLLGTVVSIIGFVIAQAQREAARALYNAVEFGDDRYDDVLNTYSQAGATVDAWGSFVLLSLLGVLLTLVVYSLRRPELKAA